MLVFCLEVSSFASKMKYKIHSFTEKNIRQDTVYNQTQ